MSDLGEPRDGGIDKPPKRKWDATRKDRFFDLKFSHYVEILLTAALVGIAYFQYTVYKRQAGIMQSQADIATEQNKISMEAQRAFLFVKETPWAGTKDDAGNAVWNLLVAWENNGTTQPKHVIMDTYCPNLVKKGDPTKFRPRDWPIFHRVIGPKQETFAGSCQPELSELQAAQRHQKWFYIVATAIYDDVFGGEHITEYCQMIDFIVGDLTNTATAPLRSTSACQVHNCADDECADKDEQRKMLLSSPEATEPLPSRPIQ
jgi:hypothetical protein